MSDSPQDPKPASGNVPADGHVSFVKKLERRFGKDIDPKVHLQEDESGGHKGEKTDEERTPSSRSRGLIEKLSDSGSGSGRYKIRSEIARGGMGTVMRVWDEDLRRNLAMKVMLGDPATGSDSGERSTANEERLERFLEEAQVTGQLDHPGVVPVHELGIDSEGRVFFTMRLVRGRELKDVLDLTRDAKEGWTVTRVLGLFLKICETMAFAHSKGVVHRDLKPANIMVGRFGEVYVMDWGLARVLGRDDTKDIRLKAMDDSQMSLVRTTRREGSSSNSPLMTMDGDVVGTPSFMSPEQARGIIAEVGPRSDVYSLGSILYYLLTGLTPYVGREQKVTAHAVLSRLLQGPPEPVAKEADRDLPPELFAICEKAMAREKNERYASMLELADDIQAFLENRVVRAYEGGSIAEFKKWCVRNRGMAAATAGLLILALVSALGFALQKSRQFEALQEQRNQVEAARAEALDNLRRAQESEREAQANLQLANTKKEEADRNAGRAHRNEQLARHSSYRANVLAADYSLRLNDVVEARRLLGQTSEDLRGWEWRHLNLRSHEAMRTFRPGDQWVDAASWGPDGSWIAAITRRGELVQFDVASGNRIPLLESRVYRFNIGASGQVEISMDVSRDGKRAVFTGNERELRVFDLVQGRTVESLPRAGDLGHQKLATTAAYSPDQRWIASGSQVGEVLVWDAESGAIVQRFGGQSEAITAIVWSVDSQRFATGSRDHTVRVLDATNGRVLHVLRGHQGPVTDLDWQPFTEVLASAAEDGAVLVWDARAGDLTRSLIGHAGAVLAVSLHPTELRLGSGGEDQTIRLWNFASEEEASKPQLLLGHAGRILDLEYRADGRRILSAGEDHLVKIWDAQGSVGVTGFASGTGGAAARFSPDMNLVATTETLGLTISIWDAWSMEPRSVLRGHTRHVQSLSFSPDGSRLLSGSGDKVAILWDVASGTELRRYEGSSARIASLSFGPEGKCFASTWGRSAVRVWDVETGEALRDLQGHDGWIRTLAVSADGRRIAAAGLSGDVTIWGPDDSQPEDVIPGHEGGRGASGLVFTKDGSRLVSCGAETMRVWNLQRSDPELIVTQESRAISVTLFPDESRIATGAADGLIRVWDAVTGELLVKLATESQGASFGVNSVQFSPDGKRLLASTGEGVQVWETADAERRLDARYEATLRRSKVQPLVDALFARHFFLEDVLLRIRADEALSDDARSTALALSRVRGDDPWALSRTNIAVLIDREGDPKAYEVCLRRALAAFSLQRDSPQLRAMLGIAHYRVGDVTEALSTLEEAWDAQVLARAERASLSLTSEQEVFLLSFLSLAYHDSGEAVQARVRLDDARRRLGALKSQAGPHTAAAMAEAEERVGVDS